MTATSSLNGMTGANVTHINDRSITDNPTERRALFAIVGVLSILCNGALCIVVIKNKRMLRNSYNIFILILALMDTITGFFIVVSPSFVVGNGLMPVPPGIQGRIFCIVLQKNLFVWLLAKCSIAMVMCMAIERWYALARPHRYKYVFTARKAIIYAVVMCVETFVVFMPTFYPTYVEVKGSKVQCVTRPIFGTNVAQRAYIVLYCTLTAFIPFVVITVSYLHLKFYVRRRQKEKGGSMRRRHQLEIILSRMSAVTAFVLAVCIFPSQVTLILFNFDVISWDVVNLWSTMSTINSVVNPWIYCLTNRIYRREFFRLFFPCKYKSSLREKPFRRNTTSEMRTGVPQSSINGVAG